MIETLLTPKEVANLLKVKVSTIYNFTHTKRIPFIKVGKFIRFKEKDIIDWLDMRRRGIVPEDIDRLIQ